jgi:hypothetical protein
MKKVSNILTAKIFATLNIFIAIAVLLMCYINIGTYYQVLAPKNIASVDFLYEMLAMAGLALALFAAALLFILNKKIGWWLLTIASAVVVVLNIIPLIQMDFTPPASYNLNAIAPIFLISFYFSLMAACLSKKVRKHFNVYKQQILEVEPDEESLQNNHPK